jgi:4-amino-4-deoxy-L-arabinose transferase-like glycosyltransferase
MQPNIRNARPKLLRAPVLAFFFAMVSGIVLWLSAHPNLGGPGLTWDEAYYYPTYRDVAGWAGQVLRDPSTALSAEAINKGWEKINELPPVTKWLGAATMLLPGEGWNRLAALRTFPAILFAVTLFILWLTARRLVPYRWAWLAPSLYGAHPILAGHAQLAASETTFAAISAAALCVLVHRPERRWTTAALLGVLAGLAIATKVNGLILIVAIGMWLTGGRFLERRAHSGWMANEGRTMVMVVLGAPLIAFAIWPWLWPAPASRLVGYWKFIAEHAHQGAWFAGQRWNFGGPPAPIWYPIANLHLMSPLVFLAALWIGIAAIAARSVGRRRLPRRELILLLCMLGPLSASSLPGAPKYDGVRLFLPAFVPAVLLSVRGCWVAWAAWKPQARRAPLWALVLLPALSFSPPNIDFYNAVAVRLTPGEIASPWETTYWVNGLNKRAVDELNAELLPNARIRSMAMQPLVPEVLTGWGVLRGDIVWGGDPPYDYHLMQNRKGFWGNAEWAIYSLREPLQTWGRGATGEPLIYLYDGRPPGQ